MFGHMNGARRLAFQLPSPLSSSLINCRRRRHEFLTFLVLDSASAVYCKMDCAAMLVPEGKEREWIYCSEGGQWQLLASSSAARLLLVSRRCIDDFLYEESYEEVFVDGLGLNFPRGLPRKNVCSNGKRKSSRGKHVKSGDVCVVNLDNKCRKTLGGDKSDALSLLTETTKIYLLKGELSTLREVKMDKEKDGSVLDERCSDMKIMEREKEKVSSNECLFSEYRSLSQDTIRGRKRQKRKSCKGEDDHLKEALAPLLGAFAPRAHSRTNIPFVSYEDDVVQRVIVEEAFSPLIGQMVVEDVEIGINEKPMSCRPDTTFRRRLRFKRMPNLIQTEVPIVRWSSEGTKIMEGNMERAEITKEKLLCSSSDLSSFPTVAQSMDTINYMHKELIGVSKRTTRNEKADNPSEELSSMTGRKFCDMRVDLERLVHVYLPHIVAGLVLVAPCLEACIKNAKRPKVLAVGIGGGALPLFLHRHFQFDIHAVDIDQTVVALARRHFGLVEDEHLRITVADGLRVLSNIAEHSIESHLESKEQIRAQQGGCITSSQYCPINNDKWEESMSSERSILDNWGLGLGSGQESFDNLSRIKKFAGLSSLGEPSTFHNSNENCLEFPGKSSAVRTLDTQGASTNLNQSNMLLNTQENADQTNKVHDKEDPCLDVIIIDVDADDASFELNSPPQTFLERKLLLAARKALHIGGMLAMNVLPSRGISYVSVIHMLQEVFDDIYEIQVGAGDNYVVFALPAPVGNLNHNSAIGIQVQSLIGENLIGQLRKASRTIHHIF